MHASERLIREYAWLARHVAKDFFLPGAEPDDVEQEAFIGLWKAARDYDGSSPFRAFATLCIRRQIIVALKSARALKHIPLSEAQRTVELGDGPVEILEVIEDVRADVATLVELRERISILIDRMENALTEVERTALLDYVNERQQFDTRSGSRDKRFENGIDRARRKLAA